MVENNWLNVCAMSVGSVTSMFPDVTVLGIVDVLSFRGFISLRHATELWCRGGSLL